MAHEHLATYLNDHLAGSVVALELLEHLEAVQAASDLGEFFSQLKADIAADRKELEGLMKALNIDQSGFRKASAWLTEKLTEMKLRFDDPKAGALLLFESLEALSLGIEGKRSLWIVLSTTAEELRSLKVLQYDRLIERAQAQRNRVESLRLETAKKALV
jgi:hypothetical protein